MIQQLRSALVLLLIFSLIVGVGYPLLVTGAAQVLFPHQANGSIINWEGRSVGSQLIGQGFSDPRYFWGRLSATPGFPYNAGSSSGSNYGPLNPELVKAAGKRIGALRSADPGNGRPIPVDLVTSSGSGLDPDISPAAAEYQVGRVARVRGLPEAEVRRLVAQHTRGRQWGMLGEPRTNVLGLNMALDELQ